MNDIFECTERIEMGLFAIEKGSRWRMYGIKHSDFQQKSMVRIREINVFNDMWVEIPQSLFALNFKSGVCA